jgi:hypothetical protein
VFYRPISSYAFWIDWKLFGNHEPRYTLLAIVFHVTAVWQFTLLSFTLFRYFHIPKPGTSSLISGLFFVDGLYALSTRQQTNLMVFEHWKNMPESLVTLFFCLSLTAYVNRLTLQESDLPAPKAILNKSARLLRDSAPVLWYLASSASKEAGILLPFLLIPLELPNLTRGGQDRIRALKRLTPVMAALPLFVLIRELFLGMSTGYTYGSNGSWVGRITDILLGAAGHDLRTGNAVPLLMGISLTVSICLFVYAAQRRAEVGRNGRICLHLACLRH